MELWGRIVGGSLWVFAGVFAAVAVLAADPDARVPLLVAAAISAAAALGAPRLARLFQSFTGDERLLADGVLARATLTAVRPTRWRYRQRGGLTIVRFELRVASPDGERIAVLHQVVPPELLSQLAVGSNVGVRVDPGDRARIVIDWRLPLEAPPP